jgi:FtsP/CotA-like multicopper oxidase with cupredoxin domain
MMRGLPLSFALAGSLLGIAGCASSTERAIPTQSLWGPKIAEDHDPDPAVVEVHLDAAATEMDWQRDVLTEQWAYNAQVPGPVIEMTQGQTLRVHFTNDLSQDTTIHWHGLRIPNDMDGVPLVQEPVTADGGTFTYTFIPPDAGTFWYHPHIRTNEQVERGLNGTLVVHERDPVPVNADRVMVLDDIDLQPNGELAPFTLDDGWATSTWGRLGNTLLLNGKNVAGGPVTARVVSGGVERWRLVNSSNARTFRVEVLGAAARVIGRDAGLMVSPVEQDLVVVAPGQRVELEVLPGDKPVELWQVMDDGFGGEHRVILFAGTPDAEQSPAEPLSWQGEPLPEHQPIEQTLTLELNQERAGPSTRWSINDESWPDSTSVALAIDVPTEVTIVNRTKHEHPFHVHGHFFEVVTIDGVAPKEQTLMDSVHLSGFQTAVLYTRFDNMGKWMAHCHILEHAQRGMMTVFDVQ